MINEHNILLANKHGERISPMYQWDKGQVLVFPDTVANGTEVQFDDGTVKLVSNHRVSIPDALLEDEGIRSAWVQIIGTDHETTTYQLSFAVIGREKKDDYVSPDDEQTFREEIEERIAEVESEIPYVHSWALAENKPSYTASEVGALPNTTVIPDVPSWAMQSSKPTYTAQEVGALPSSTVIPTVPTTVSSFQNDAGYLTEHQSLAGKQDKLTAGANITISDDNVISASGGGSVDVPDWAMQPNKPTYTASEVGALPDTTVIPTVPSNVSAFTNDAGYLTEHQSLAGKADAVHSHVMEDITDMPSIPQSADDIAYGESNVADELGSIRQDLANYQTLLSDAQKLEISKEWIVNELSETEQKTARQRIGAETSDSQTITVDAETDNIEINFSSPKNSIDVHFEFPIKSNLTQKGRFFILAKVNGSWNKWISREGAGWIEYDKKVLIRYSINVKHGFAYVRRCFVSDSDGNGNTYIQPLNETVGIEIPGLIQGLRFYGYSDYKFAPNDSIKVYS